MIVGLTRTSIRWETGCSYDTPMKRQEGSGSYQDHGTRLIGSLHVMTLAYQLSRFTFLERMLLRFTKLYRGSLSLVQYIDVRVANPKCKYTNLSVIYIFMNRYAPLNYFTSALFWFSLNWFSSVVILFFKAYIYMLTSFFDVLSACEHAFTERYIWMHLNTQISLVTAFPETLAACILVSGSFVCTQHMLVVVNIKDMIFLHYL